MLTRSAASKLGKRKRPSIRGLDSVSSSGKARRRAKRAALPEHVFELPTRMLRTALANEVLRRGRIVQCASADGDALIRPNADDETFRVTGTVSVKLDRATYQQMVRDWEHMTVIEMEEEQARFSKEEEEDSSLVVVPESPPLEFDLNLDDLAPLLSPLAMPGPEPQWAPVTSSRD